MSDQFIRAPHLKCKSDVISSEWDESAVFCSVRVECDADNSIAGQEQILVLSHAFRIMEYPDFRSVVVIF